MVGFWNARVGGTVAQTMKTACLPAILLLPLCVLCGCDKGSAGSSRPEVTKPKVIPGMEPMEVAPGDAPVFASDPPDPDAEQAGAQDHDDDPVPELVIRDGSVYGRIMIGDRAVLQVEAGIEPGDCDQMNVSLDPIEGREDLRALQLFCETGEDYFSREIDTFLISMGTYEVHWQGGGTYRNEMGVCQEIDVPWFEPLPDGMVVVYQETGVFHEPDPGLDVECTPKSTERSDLDTLTIPVP